MAIGFRTASASTNGSASQTLLMTTPGTPRVITQRAAPVGSNNGAGATTLVVTFPTGHVAGDILVFAITVRGGTGTTITTPTGWTLLDRHDDTTTLAQAMFWIVDTGSLGSSVTVTITSQKASATCYALVNADTTAPVSAQYSGQSNTTTSLNVDFAATGTWTTVEGISILFGGVATDSILYNATGYLNNDVIDSVTASAQGASTGGSAASRTMTTSAAIRTTASTIGTQQFTGGSGTAAVSIGHSVFIKEAVQVAPVAGDVMLMAVTAAGGSGSTVAAANTLLLGGNATGSTVHRSLDGTLVGTNGSAGNYWILDSTTLLTRHQFAAGNGNSGDFCIAGDNSYLAAYNSNTMSLFSLPSGTETQSGVIGTPTNGGPASSLDGNSIYFPVQSVGVKVLNRSLSVVTTISGSLLGYYITLTPDGKYLLMQDSGRVRRIRTSDNSVVDITVSFTNPGDWVVNSTSTFAYFAAFTGNQLIIVDIVNATASTISVGTGPTSVAITSDDRFVYVGDASPSTVVSVVQTSNNTVLTTITGTVAPNKLAAVANTQIVSGSSSAGVCDIITVSSNTIAGQVTLGSTLIQSMTSASGLVFTGQGSTDGVAAIDAPNLKVASGWKQLGSQTNSTTALAQSLYWKVAGSNEPPQYRVPLGASVVAAGTIIVLSGAAQVIPPSSFFGAQANASSTTVTAPALGTWSSQNGIDVSFSGTAVSTSFTPPTSYTEPSSAEATTTGVASEGAYRALSAVTTVGSISSTAGSAAVNIGAHVFVAESVGSTAPEVTTVIRQAAMRATY